MIAKIDLGKGDEAFYSFETGYCSKPELKAVRLHFPWRMRTRRGEGTVRLSVSITVFKPGHHPARYRISRRFAQFVRDREYLKPTVEIPIGPLQICHIHLRRTDDTGLSIHVLPLEMDRIYKDTMTLMPTCVRR